MNLRVRENISVVMTLSCYTLPLVLHVELNHVRYTPTAILSKERFESPVHSEAFLLF